MSFYIHLRTYIFELKGYDVSAHSRPEFTARARAIRQWRARVDLQTLYIAPACPWENVYNEVFNGRLRDELMNGEIFETVLAAGVLCALATLLAYCQAS